MLNFSECKRTCLCIDCNDSECLHAGKIIADCPKYHCDNPNGIEKCENCEFINEFHIVMRSAYENEKIKSDTTKGR